MTLRALLFSGLTGAWLALSSNPPAWAENTQESAAAAQTPAASVEQPAASANTGVAANTVEEATATETIPVLPLKAGPKQIPPGTSTEDPPVLLEAVTVTATKTARSSFAVPESVSIISADQIENYSASDLAEALKGVVGVNIANGPRSGGESVNIRGIEGTRVLMSVDGARQNYDGAHRSRLNVDPDLLKSIDVLRGPASAIWGSDALGGVISLTTKDAADLLKPGEKLGGRIKLGSESADHQKKVGGSAFARLGSLDLLADFNRLDASDLQQAGGRTLPYSAFDTQGGLFKLTRFLSDASELGVSLQTFSQGGTAPSNPSQETSDSNPLLNRQNNQRYLTGRYTYQAQDDATLIAGGNLTLYRSSLAVVEDRVISPRHDTLNFATTGASVQTSFNLPAWASKITTGGEFFADTARATRNGAPRPQFPDAQRKVGGVFLQNELQLTTDWLLIPGLRHDRYRSHSNTGAAAGRDQSANSLKLGTAYQLTRWLSLNASYGEAFRAPSLLETYAQGTHFLGNEFRPNPGLRPERAKNKEAGLRLKFGDLTGGGDRLQFKASVFDNRIRDYIETIVLVQSEFPAARCIVPMPPPGCVNRDEDGKLNPESVPVYVGGYTSSENLPEARIRGAELESAYERGHFSLGASYSTLRGENLADGSPLLNIPANTLIISAGYKLFDTLSLGLRATHAATQDRVPVDAAGNPLIPRTPGYTVTDFYAVWQSQRFAQGLRINLGVDNLGDRLYRNHLARQAEAGRSLRAGFTYPL